jgi:hypothetical protein
MSDLLFQQISTVQSNEQLNPPTIASAATISPQTLVTFLTGTVQLATINPPVTGCHMLVLIFTNASPGAFVTTGNLQAALQPIQNLPMVLFYDPVSAKYWGSVGTLT